MGKGVVSMLKRIETKVRNIYKKLEHPQNLPKIFSGERYIYSIKEGIDIIAKSILSQDPILISRYGTTELSIIEYFIKNRKKWSCSFPDNLKQNISILSGFYPATDDFLCRFSCEALSIFNNIDILGVRSRVNERDFYEIEDIFINNYTTSATLIDICSLSPLNINYIPWMRCLKGKKVLVIHPFSDTIYNQYQKRKEIFEKQEIFLPDFTLLLCKAVQTLQGSPDRNMFSNWFEALQFMEKEICSYDFDIALIGAGAYGMFLGNYIKNIGKKAIHIGGALQLLFGIKGKRWDISTEITKFYNDAWVYPCEKDKYNGYRLVEGGCYYG